MTETVPGPDYERAIMDAHAAGEPAPDIAPPDDYHMSPEFQEWLVATMRDAIMQSDDLGSALTGAARNGSKED